MEAPISRPWRQSVLTLCLAIPCLVLAAPPDWAPAHGWRRASEPARSGYTGYSGNAWDSDFGVRSGSCDRSRVGQVMGGAIGGVAGGAIAGELTRESGHRDVAIVAGAVVGAVIGAEIGRRLDKTDRSCVGHALELAEVGSRVQWTNPNTRVTYQLTPLDDEPTGDGCRRFRLIAHGSFGLSEGRTVACPDVAGVWRLAEGQRASLR